MRTRLFFGGGLLLTLLGASLSARAQQSRTASLPASNEEPSYRKEFTYGVNFNTRGGLIGGVSVRFTRPLSQDWARFWSIEAVEVKHPKEYKEPTQYGAYVNGKSDYLFVLRPSIGIQRVIFRKAPDSGVQVNALLGAGPSIGLLMPYYITYDYTLRDASTNAPIGATDYRNEQFNPRIHGPNRIVDRAPLFSGISETKPTIGAHLRGALSFEYGRYRDAVAGVETGFLFEAYTKRLTILRERDVPDNSINSLFFPSVYLTIYLGHRS